MAGSFQIFRRYQKAALAGLAIMAMLAFFVLPPILQMGQSGGPVADGEVVSWKGGGLRESGLQRAVKARRALNQFLMEVQAAATGNAAVQPLLPGDEKSVVDSLLMAREAEANGIVVSDAVVNDFLAIWTGDRVSQADMRGVIDQLRERAGVTEQDIFDGLRTVLLGDYMRDLALQGARFSNTPPGWRWDAFRRLEQSATVEVVPVIVESLGGEVPKPTTAALEAVYAKYKDDLPRAVADTPGFREPARIRYDALVATPDVFVAEAEKAVTDEQIAKFYEDNKGSLYKQAAKPDDAAEKADAKPDDKAPDKAPDKEDKKESDEKAAAAPGVAKPESAPADKPADKDKVEAKPSAAPESTPPVPTEPPPATPEPAAPAGDPKAAGGARPGLIRQAAFRQPGEAAADAAKEAVKDAAAAAGEKPAAPPAADAEKPATAVAAGEEQVKPAAESGKPGAVVPEAGGMKADAAAGTEAGDKEATDKQAGKADAKPEEKPAYEPLDKVRDDIRKRLAREAADKKLAEIFDKLTGRIATYADDVELALGVGEPVPPSPDVEKIAAEHGLQAVRSDFVDRGEAIAAGGAGRSFRMIPSQMSARQVHWADMLFAPDRRRWQPEFTQDFAGNRYLSWKTEDRPEFTPAFTDVRDEVERVWRLIEARPLAKKRAEAIAAAAAGKDLTAAIAGQEGAEVTKVGPFTWLTRGTAPFGSAPMISQPAGVQMAGNEFMEVVFGLEPGGTATAFNEPKTICYCIRLVAYEPDEAVLQDRFADVSTDPRRLATLADDETREVRDLWMAGIEKRYGVEWKRDPR